MMSLIIGGSGSGKSEYAENRSVSLAGNGEKYYLATMQVFGEEGKHRVKRHRKLRAGKGFSTIEQTVSVHHALQFMENAAQATVLLECMTNLTANEMFTEHGPIAETDVVKKLTSEIEALHAGVRHLILVTGNVFEDGNCYDEATMSYIRVLGNVNRRLAAMADEVVEVVAGIPIMLKEKN